MSLYDKEDDDYEDHQKIDGSSNNHVGMIGAGGPALLFANTKDPEQYAFREQSRSAPDQLNHDVEAAKTHGTMLQETPSMKVANPKDETSAKQLDEFASTHQPARPQESFQLASFSAELMQEIHSNASLPDTFPFKLHKLLEDAETEGHTNLVSWLANNRSFRVHDLREFEKKIIPRYFRQTKYKSFLRQLNLWGFESINEGSSRRAGYFHPKFIRGQPELCHEMKRVKRSSAGGRDRRRSNSNAQLQGAGDALIRQHENSLLTFAFQAVSSIQQSSVSVRSDYSPDEINDEILSTFN